MKGGFWRVAEGSEGVGLWTVVQNSCKLRDWGRVARSCGELWTKTCGNSWKLMFCKGCGRRMGGFGRAESCGVAENHQGEC